jgi:hypothetical protein
MKAEVIGLLSGVLILAGCAEGPYRARTQTPVTEDIARVVLMNDDLVDELAVDGVEAFYNKHRRLHVEIKVRNRTGDPLAIQIQTVFKSERGTEIGDATAWQGLVLSANSTRGYRATAIKPDARRYTVRIRHQQ